MPGQRSLFPRALAPALVLAAAGAQTSVRLDTLDLSGFEQEWGAPHADRAVDGHPLSIGGKGHEHGVGTHAYSEAEIDLGRGATAFTAVVGVDDEECGGKGSVVFVLLVDGQEKLRTPVRRRGDAGLPVRVDLAGAASLTLVVENGGDGNSYDHADWADARIDYAAGADAKPRLGVVDDVAPAIVRPAAAAPRLGHPRATGGTPGKPFLFRIPASGQAPLAFAAEGLPPGVELDPATGILRGSLRAAGTSTVNVTVRNAAGSVTRPFTLVAGADGLARTPPLGWNSWNCWALAVDDAKVRAAADAFVQSGLAAHGFAYVNIDDGWEAGRDAAGNILANERFPDMKGLADYVHARGLKLGIYSSPGPKTCGGYTGSWQHEAQDAATWAAWGIDYVKYDWCSYGDIAPHPDRAALQKPYLLLRDALRAGPRDILFSLCQYGMGDVWQWGASVGGNCWRTTGDITDSWSSMAGIGFAQGPMAPFAGPGHWNDPDMLVVGQVGWGPSLHATHLTKNEQITHVSLWAMLGAPLLIGCDLTRLDEFTLALLTDDDVLAIDQDPLGRTATRCRQQGQTEVWTRPLADGTTAVALCNRGRKPVSITATWQELGLAGPQPVHDCWTGKDTPGEATGVGALVPRHGTVLLRVGTGRD